jgi:hypothetical protein
VRQSFAIIPICAMFLGGCAINPLPEHVTGNTTFDIVKKIRCEALYALDDLSVKLLQRSDYPPLLELAGQIEAGTLTVPEFFLSPRYQRVRSHLSRDVLNLFLTYTLTAATFDFDFDITERNESHATANFTLPLTWGVFSLGSVNAGGTFVRKSERKFMVTDSFYELHLQRRAYCANVVATVGNVIYPITGKIGLEEIFHTFVSLDSAEGGLPKSTTSNFSHALTFTTTLSSGLTPKIVLNPGPINQFRLADANLALSGSRVDEHKVTISLAKGPVLKSIEQAREIAKKISRANADQRRMEDLIIVPRNNVVIVR